MIRMLHLLFALFVLVSCSAGEPEFKEGDVIFQTSQSKQSPLIALATASDKTHCGIIIEKKGEFYVLETLGTIKLTPVKKFIDRGLLKRYWVKRPHRDDIKIRYRQYLGIPYDLAFKFDNGKYYCSELVYEIYRKQLGIQLCEPRQLKEYHLTGLQKKARARGMNLKQYVVSPDDLFHSDELD